MKTDKNSTGKNNKGGSGSRKLRGGAYTIILSLMVLAIAFVFNLAVGELPGNIIRFDTTNRGIYTLSDQTEKIVGDLKEDITIYTICQAGKEDEMLFNLIDRYKALSDRITVKNVDPVYEPAFTSAYTGETVEDNSIIVESSKRHTLIYNRDIYEYIYDDYYDASFEAFNGEAVITSAIDFVTADDMPKLYKLVGHSELPFTQELTASVERENIIYDELNLVSSDIPEDAGCIMIYSPKNDISAVEAEKLRDYLSDGGRLMLITDYSDAEFPNLMSVVWDYGVDKVDGIVVEGDTSKVVAGYNHYLLPDICSHVITDPLIQVSSTVLMPVCSGIRVQEGLRSSVEVSPLLMTSDSAYSKTSGSKMTTYAKEEGDIDGPFNVAVAIEENYHGSVTKIVWFTNSGFLLKEVDESVSGANIDIFLNSLGWMCERDSGISIRAKSLNMDYLTVSNSTLITFAVIAIGVIPFILIAVGIIVVIRRRKRT